MSECIPAEKHVEVLDISQGRSWYVQTGAWVKFTFLAVIVAASNLAFVRPVLFSTAYLAVKVKVAGRL